MAIEFQSRNSNENLNFVQLIFLSFIFIDIFSGLLRAVFYALHLNILLMLPKLLMGLVPLYYFGKGVNRPKIIITYFIIFLGCIVSYYNFGNIPQALFGMYILFPFLFAYCIGFDEIFSKKVNLWLRSFFYVALFGVFLNRIIDFPWAGMEVDIGGMQLAITKSWEAFGTKRVPGFSSASYTAATQLLVLGTYFSIISERKLSIFISVLTAIAIYLTTTKGAIVAYALFLVFFTLKSKASFIYNIVIILLTFLNIWLPYKAYNDWLDKVNVDTLQFSDLDFGIFTLETMFERMQWMWPMSINFIVENGGWILGNGLGGIGSPLAYFYGESLIFSSADSLIVYLFGLFGMGVILLVGLSIMAAFKADWDNETGIFLKSIVLITLAFGLTGSPVERPVMLLFIGLAFAMNKSVTRLRTL